MEMTTPSTCTYTLVPIGLSLLFAQHAGLFYASTSTYSDLDLCLPRKYKKEYGRLKRLFPCDFDRHAANVPDLIPRITAWDSGDSRRFSWQLVRINHELAWPFVSMLALALMWL